ncbi:hypothetical protein QBC34DRAFT_473017 [Podospora aff. communis PSN243]|uniref:Uncharacterized protein n=1 Tax=Podospora aff. communis PSN243 TaxID=3040156 RepID=A0AAV9GDB3_9PEZI|nr:hypothetical protein QBC34DRAFT_473017 [Podospora aff. communis PSN243]
MFGNKLAITASLVLLGIHGALGTPVISRRFTPPDIDLGNTTITPGLGLPSLESLGVTVAELVEEAFREIHDETAAAAAAAPTLSRRAAVCRHAFSNMVYRASALACAGYLDRLGTTPCWVPDSWALPHGQHSRFCTANVGGFHDPVLISGYGRYQSTSSHCYHVAHAVRVVESGCAWSDFFQYAGHENAWGNGNLEVLTEIDVW